MSSARIFLLCMLSGIAGILIHAYLTNTLWAA